MRLARGDMCRLTGMTSPFTPTPSVRYDRELGYGRSFRKMAQMFADGEYEISML